MEADYIQVGVTALRDPLTRETLPAVPLYIRTDDARKACLRSSEADAANNWADDLAGLMKKYVSGCRAAGVPL